MTERYFIKRPASPEKGIPGGYIEVDPDTLQPGLLAQFYLLDEATDRYDPVDLPGYDNGTGYDPTALLEYWQVISELVELNLTDHDPTGPFAMAISDLMAKMPELIKLLTSGRLDIATPLLDSYGYGLLNAIDAVHAGSEASPALPEADVDVEAGTDQPDNTGLSPESERVLGTLADSLATAINRGLAAQQELFDYEATLDKLEADIDANGSVQSLSGKSKPGWLRDALRWLDDGMDGFCVRVLNFHLGMNPEYAGIMDADVTQARATIQSIRDRLQSGTENREVDRAIAEPVLLQSGDIESRLLKIKQARDINDRMSSDDSATYQLISSRIDPGALSHWQALRNDPAWKSVHAVKTRIRDKVDTIWFKLGADIKLSDEDQAIIARSERAIEQLELRSGGAAAVQATGSSMPVQPAPPHRVPSRPRILSETVVTPPPHLPPAPVVTSAPAAAAPRRPVPDDEWPELSPAADEAADSPDAPETLRPARKPAQKAPPKARRIELPEDIPPARLIISYEMILAISAVRFCNHHNYTGSTPEIMMDMLVILGKVTETEHRCLTPYLEEMVRKRSLESYDSKVRLANWKNAPTSSYDWIQFSLGLARSTVWRLTQNAQPRGLKLLERHGLDVGEIGRVYEARKKRRGQ